MTTKIYLTKRFNSKAFPRITTQFMRSPLTTNKKLNMKIGNLKIL